MSDTIHHKRQYLEGFSKLSPDEKTKIISKLVKHPEKFLDDVKKHSHPDKEVQLRYQKYSENTLTNFFLPYGIAPNFLINNRIYHIPMVVEESSVVAAASSAAKFWSARGGFHCKVLNTIKRGQIHFQWTGDPEHLKSFFENVKGKLVKETEVITANMQKRGGGIKNMELYYRPDVLDNYYQLDVAFDTVDSMGANFINSVLESIRSKWNEIVETSTEFSDGKNSIDMIMSILSNYTPECIVECFVESPIAKLENIFPGWTALRFLEQFLKAMTIAANDVKRAVTHNKGIFNGIDAVVLATGNDFRAVEANGHAFASRNGRYTSLSEAFVRNNVFNFRLKMPLSIGTTGGLTRNHPMAENSLEILEWPSAQELMQIIAAVGLANNFSAVKSLISTGIQSGHMKLHLSNILTQLGAGENESNSIYDHFRGKIISYQAVHDYLEKIRNR